MTFPHRYYNLNLDAHHSCKMCKAIHNLAFKKQCCGNFEKDKNTKKNIKVTISLNPQIIMNKYHIFFIYLFLFLN